MAIREDAINFTAQITQVEITNSSQELGVSPESLAWLGIGKNRTTNEFTFPLRMPNGYIIGTSNRPIEQSGRTKRTIGQGAVSRGLIFVPGALSPDYAILTEGVSDTAAVLSAGFSSVVGKASASAGIESIVLLCQRLRPRIVINLRDADKAGANGHKKLVRAFGVQPVIELLPANGFKDAREWYNADPIGMYNAIAEHLRRIGLAECDYSLPSSVTLSDYATTETMTATPMINYRLGRFEEPIHPDFKLGAIPVYLPPVTTDVLAESSTTAEQLPPTLDRNRVRFVAIVGIAGTQIESEPVDHTNPDQVHALIQDWSVQHNLDAEHLQLAIPHAVQGCLAWVASQQRQRPARLDILDDTPKE